MGIPVLQGGEDVKDTVASLLGDAAKAAAEAERAHRLGLTDTAARFWRKRADLLVRADQADPRRHAAAWHTTAALPLPSAPW